MCTIFLYPARVLRAFSSLCLYFLKFSISLPPLHCPWMYMPLISYSLSINRDIFIVCDGGLAPLDGESQPFNFVRGNKSSTHIAGISVIDAAFLSSSPFQVKSKLSVFYYYYVRSFIGMRLAVGRGRGLFWTMDSKRKERVDYALCMLSDCNFYHLQYRYILSLFPFFPPPPLFFFYLLLISQMDATAAVVLFEDSVRVCKCDKALFFWFVPSRCLYPLLSILPPPSRPLLSLSLSLFFSLSLPHLPLSLFTIFSKPINPDNHFLITHSYNLLHAFYILCRLYLYIYNCTQALWYYKRNTGAFTCSTWIRDARFASDVLPSSYGKTRAVIVERENTFSALLALDLISALLQCRVTPFQCFSSAHTHTYTNYTYHLIAFFLLYIRQGPRPDISLSL